MRRVHLRHPQSEDRMGEKNTIKINVESNLGSGKSTLIRKLGRIEGFTAIEEPVESWKNLKGKNMLKAIYNEEQGARGLFQLHVLQTMVEAQLQQTQGKVRIMERSFESAWRIFTKHQQNQKLLEDFEVEIIKDWRNTALKIPNMEESSDGTLYIRCDPKISFKRIMERNREEEKNISLEYIRQIHELYEQWLVERPEKCTKPIRIVNGNRTKDKVYNDTLVAIDEMVNEIKRLNEDNTHYF